ncbi:hypothetical protein [Oceanobacillus timonensis]|uniref:hypothetical protein n=1 Tax=Oceanobacillus timonensis TaxID=1926285 RepID=UPI0009BAF862|nr:hypothetical protein [Oceanobacillus timonensis]
MIPEKPPEELLIDQLSRKLYLTEMEEILLNLTYNLMSDKLYAKEDAFSELIRLIRLLNYEQESIMDDIIRLEYLVFDEQDQ